LLLNECQTHNWDESKKKENSQFSTVAESFFLLVIVVYVVCYVCCTRLVNMNIGTLNTIKKRMIFCSKNNNNSESHMWKEAKKTWKWNIICTKFFSSTMRPLNMQINTHVESCFFTLVLFNNRKKKCRERRRKVLSSYQ
jgi:hypothetical protein